MSELVRLRLFASFAALFPTACTLLLILLPWEKHVQFGFERVHTPPADDIDSELYSRSTVHFASGGDSLEGWLYLPKQRWGSSNQQQEGEQPPAGAPVVVMTNGLALQKDMYLPGLAAQLAQAGLASLLFDYRGFGGSGGEPRYWPHPGRHREDWTAAVQFVRAGGLGGTVDPDRVVLLGFSLSGSFPPAVAADMPDAVAAIVCLAPHVNSSSSVDVLFGRKVSLTIMARMVAASLSDHIRRWVGLPRVYVQVFGRDSDVAMGQMGQGGELDYLESAVPDQPQGGWKNFATADTMLSLGLWHPQQYISRVQCPVLLVGAARDYLTPVKYVKQAKEALPHPGSEYIELDSAHLGLPMHPDVPELVVAFLRKHL